MHEIFKVLRGRTGKHFFCITHLGLFDMYPDLDTVGKGGMGMVFRRVVGYIPVLIST